MKIYGICMKCGYEYTLENSNFAENSGDTDDYIAKMLRQYHLEASPECRSLHNDEILADLTNLIKKIEFSDRLDKQILSNSLREICRTLIDCSGTCTYSRTCDYICNRMLFK